MGEIVSESIFLLHQLASIVPETFIQGPKIAGASPSVLTRPSSTAIPDAKPPFCIPTSNAIVRQSFPFNCRILHPQYPNIYPAIL